MRDGFDLIRDAYDVAGLDEHERAVLVRLAFMANEGKAWPSIAHLVVKLGKSERTVQRAIRRLVEAGHITQRQRRHDTAIYTVHPILGDPKPVSVTGVSVTPVTATPVADDANTRPTDTLIAKNNQSSSKTSSSPKRAARSAPVSPPVVKLPDWIPVEAWEGWLEMRRTKGAKPTSRALALSIEHLRKLADAGHPPGDVLDQSTRELWLGLFPIKDPQNEQSRSTRRSPANHHAVGDAVLAAHDRVDFG
ncbi:MULTISPECIES: helix-turn-helix domain-containing protein [unclassified Sphingomonas]|uniref:helix-turn-helix domain-containing protein n=1 Tax=unclassified Sphingomonas TaxID=196159 RepID=UPI0009E970D3|nr:MULTISPECIES: helix-turn-helix domain-containing protein [unclassified Sphingomonas]